MNGTHYTSALHMPHVHHTSHTTSSSSSSSTQSSTASASNNNTIPATRIGAVRSDVGLDETLSQLLSLGYSHEDAIYALTTTDGSLDAAIEFLNS